MATTLGVGGAVGSARRDRGLLRRRITNGVVWGACGVALLAIVTPVVWILAGVVARGLEGWHWSVLWTTGQIGSGGLANAIVGTTVIVVGVAVVAGLVGIGGGIYLAEFTPEGRGGLLRGASEVLAGMPSIVLGYMGYVALVVKLHWGFSLGAALLVLSAMVVPYIVKTTEVALRNVPTAYRDGSEALGMPTSYALRRIVLRPALPGIATGLIVAMAIALGETAPLLYTANWSNHFPTAQLTHSPVGYLTYPIWAGYDYPSAAAHRQAYQAALLLIVMVVILIVASRVIVAVTQRHSESSAAKE